MGKLNEVEVRRLHPTQITVGMIEVREKRKELSELKNSDLHDFLRAHPVPAVEGPNDKLYITDHHHLGRALSEEGIATGFFLVEADLSTFALDIFWSEMDRHEWVHPYEENGLRCPFDCITETRGAPEGRPLPEPSGVRAQCGRISEDPGGVCRISLGRFLPQTHVHRTGQGRFRDRSPEGRHLGAQR
jgi:hypothetical protein